MMAALRRLLGKHQDAATDDDRQEETAEVLAEVRALLDGIRDQQCKIQRRGWSGHGGTRRAGTGG